MKAYNINGRRLRIGDAPHCIKKRTKKVKKKRRKGREIPIIYFPLTTL